MTIIVSSSTTASVSTTWDGDSYSDSRAHVVGASENMLVVFISGPWIAAPTVSYGGSSLTLQETIVDGNGGSLHAYDLKDPATGANNLVIDTGGASRDIGVAIYTLESVDDVTPRGASQQTAGSASTASDAHTTTAGDCLIDALAYEDSATSTAGAGQTVGADELTGPSGYNLSTSTEIASSTSTDMSWTLSGSVSMMHVSLHYIGAAASNSAPVVDDQTFSVADSASNGTVIVTLVATDSDGTVDSYAISGSTLAINSTTGQITLADNAGIVAGTPITATATVTDDAGDTDTATVTVNVTNSGLSFSCYDADSSNAAITSETLSHVRVLDPADLSEVATATSIATSSTGSAEIDTDSVTIGTDYLVIARRSNGDVCEPFSVTASDLAAS